MAEMTIPIVIFLCVLLSGSLRATTVYFTKEWKQDFGWEVTCHWVLEMEDSLQQVAIYRNDQQFFVFRPEGIKGNLRKTSTFTLTNADLGVDCLAGAERGIKGRCIVSVVPVEAPDKDFTFSCSVSGERPYFRIGENVTTVEALVPPSDAIMTVHNPLTGPPSINCTTSGLPSPRILWLVEDQKVPHHFHQSHWNETSKLWDVWSTFTPQSDAAGKVKCVPYVVKGQREFKGKPVTYNNAFRIFLGGPILALAVITSILLS